MNEHSARVSADELREVRKSDQDWVARVRTAYEAVREAAAHQDERARQRAMAHLVAISEEYADAVRGAAESLKWEAAVQRAERGETVAVIAHGDHVADVVPSGELHRLRETVEVLSDNDLVQQLRDGLRDLRDGRTYSLADIESDIEARRAP
ncbi:hypothetical protein GCM10022247_14140 [Allokutzneria multivorans]|uniref:Uncharacterized protein n=1 Tax=Allokutzneria multivorans TaxID=1142134 RepID=A0ABP7RCL8_9PSEU